MLAQFIRRTQVSYLEAHPLKKINAKAGYPLPRKELVLVIVDAKAEIIFLLLMVVDNPQCGGQYS